MLFFKYFPCFLQIVIYRYDDWLNGQDYGRHPEEPNAKLTPANPPTAEEFMVNNRNKDKKIPLCLLEPKEKKKRRHPIHKNKNLGESMNFVTWPNLGEIPKITLLVSSL